MREISAGDADTFRLSLVADKLSSNTVAKHIAVAKVFFHAAVRKRLIASNPFDGLKSTIHANKARDYFVTRDEAMSIGKPER